MAMVGAERNFTIRPPLTPPPRLLPQQPLDDRHHIGIAAQMVILDETAVIFDRHIAQMHEMDAVGELFHHARQIIVAPRTE